MAHDVFLSYSSNDEKIAAEVCAALEASGVKCWIARRDIVGGMFSSAIVRAIRACKIVVLIFSSSANKSLYVAQELERAVNHEKVICTFRIEDVQPSEHLELWVSAVQWLDAWIPPKEDRLKQLTDNVKVLLAEFVPPPPPPPSETNIIVQTIGVSHYRDRGGQESFMYAPAPLGEVAQDSVLVPVNWQSIQQHLWELRTRVEDLTRRALVGQRREQSAIESIANSLARNVLPAGGFLGMMSPGVNPQLDLIQDAASEIPWEVFEESYFTCSLCHHSTLPHRPPVSAQPYCERCGTRMDAVGGKLSLVLHITHVVRGISRPDGNGQQFLFIEDPNGDLCGKEKDPQHLCREHLVALRQVVKQLGYMIRQLSRKEATVEAVLNALADPMLGGVYYYGHGFFPSDGDEGCLCLADGKLFASRIRELEPTAKFVFLNTCEGAATGRNWQIEKRSSSVAQAFARGGRGRVVIAPIWPMVNLQAAEAALEFFQSAASATPLGEALRSARQKSLQRYQDGESHLSWMAYRFFGDPNKCFPIPPVTVAAKQSVVPPTARSRIFDEREQLDTELFAFGIDEVLLYAARRRNHACRKQLTLSDFLSGLIRTGDLTRYVLMQRQISPDRLYEKMIESTVESVASGAGLSNGDSNFEWGQDEDFDFESADEEQLREFLSKWIVRRKDEFDAPVISLMESAETLAQRRKLRTHDHRISEQDLLESLTANETWAKQATEYGLPERNDVRVVLAERERVGEIDENGALTLNHLDPVAKKLIETAHELAQQRGIFPIPHRLMFAAFLSNEKGFAARTCAAAGAKPETLLSQMLAATEHGSPEDHPPFSFGLGLEACERIVLPVIAEAKKITPIVTAIREEDLFKAFCKEAAPEFKEWLNQPPDAFDLDSLFTEGATAIVSLDGLGQEARLIIETAHVMAQNCASYPIPNRLLLAAFLMQPNGYATRLLKQQNIAAEALSVFLRRVAGNGPLRLFPLSQEACERIITPTLMRAQERSPGVITEQLLFKAFCAVAEPKLKQVLKAPPWNLDLDTLDFEHPLPETKDMSSQSGKEQPLSAEQFEENTWQILLESSRLAREQGWTEVKSPHLYAAMIGDGSGSTGLVLQKKGVNPEELKRLILQLVPTQPLPSNAPASELCLGKHARLIISRATLRARVRDHSRVTSEDLLAGFLSDGGGVVGEVLRSLGIDLRALLVTKSTRVEVSNNGNIPHQGKSVQQ